MVDLLAAAGAAFVAVFTERAKTVIEWLVHNLVSLALLVLLFGAMLESVERGGKVLILNPVAAAYRMAEVFGITNTSWLDAIVAWLERTELQPVAVTAAIIAGVVVFWDARYATESAWLLLIPVSVSLGATALWFALSGLAATVLVFMVIAGISLGRDSRVGERVRFGPTFVVESALRGLFSWALTPFVLVFRLLNGLDETVTYRQRQDPPTGAVAMPK